MNRDIAKLWVEALRSGKYEQGKRQLKQKEGGFCCLGVLCDISHKGNWVKHPDGFYDYIIVNGMRVDKSGSVLPVPILEWAKMKTHDGTTTKFTLTKLNDRGHSFEEIANLIEESVEEL